MSGVVYITDESHKALLDETYCLFSWTNPLHADVFPSVSQKTCLIVTHPCIGKCSPRTTHSFCQQQTLCAGVSQDSLQAMHSRAVRLGQAWPTHGLAAVVCACRYGRWRPRSWP